MLHVVRGLREATIHGNALELGPVVVTHRGRIRFELIRITEVVHPVPVFQVAGDCIRVVFVLH